MKPISTRLFQVLFVVGAAAAAAASTAAHAAPSQYWLEGACGEDVKKHCSKAGAGEVMKCLRANEKDWTPSCREKFAEKRGHAESQSGASEKKK